MHIPYHQDTRRHSGEMPHEGRLGVIDIGSNSVRLVIYDAIKRTPLPIFNEKILCGLGKGLAISGKLNPEGKALAESSIKRFLALVRIMDVVELQVIATAAVRDASDGTEFVESLERKYRLNITVISGRKEAQLAAAGVFSSIYKASGLAGDLGGGSIELIGVDDGLIGEQTTIPIGPLRLLDTAKEDRLKTGKIIAKALDEETWLPGLKPKHFYAVGGSFRALAHIHMRRQDYPLEIVHHYTVKTPAMRKFLKDIIHASPEVLAKMPGAPAKRVESLVPAAQVLDRILEITHPADVVFCSSGIREGYLYERLTPYVRNEDSLIASCTDLASQNGRVPGYARELFNWMSPIFGRESDSEKRLRLAACILSELAWRIHPDYRAEWAFNRIIQSTITGLSHPERVTLALALYHRYQHKLKNNSQIVSLIKEKDRAWARTVGIAANLAFQLSGAMAGNLNNVSLALRKGRLEVAFNEESQDLLGDTVRKRIDGLGEAFKELMK
ncbi:MAG TPA: Ppx/GppA family phosphatase [Rickettsiales bacterium]|nr:Ppx/GppA family phosphatase [Rickettsiales bacterium]